MRGNTGNRKYVSTHSGFLILLCLFIVSTPRATVGHYSDPTGHAHLIKIPNTITKSPRMTGTLVAPAVSGPSPVSGAAIFEESGPSDLSINASVGDDQIVLERRRRTGLPMRYMELRLKVVFIATVISRVDEAPQEIDLRARIIGADDVRGSLLYALAWLAGDTNPLGSVRALGYDIDVSMEHDRPCAHERPSEMCVERARRLATLLDATLALGDPDERAMFRQNAASLGLASDCSAPVSRMASSDGSGPSDLSIDASVGDKEIVLERRKTRNIRSATLLVIKIKDVSSTSLHRELPQRIDLGAMIEGADASHGSLVYALAWLAGDMDPLGTVRALGYDVEVRNEHERPCTDQLSSQTCVTLARQLATLIDATLGFGSPEERARFRQDASSIGIAPDCAPQEP